jgi:hypothetical protein
VSNAVINICFILIYLKLICRCADHSSRAVQDMKCPRSLELWYRGFEFHSRHGCLCAFILCLFSCVEVAALRRADPQSKEFYRLCIGSRNLKSGQGPTKTCRAIIFINAVIQPIQRRMENWDGRGKKLSWPNLRYYLRIYPEELSKTTEILSV